jgi:hypothetical protein
MTHFYNKPLNVTTSSKSYLRFIYIFILRRNVFLWNEVAYNTKDSCINKRCANKFRDSPLILRRAIWQCCYLKYYATQEGRAHMESLNKLLSLFVEE